MQRRLPALIANLAKNHFLSGFDSGGGKTNASAGGWDARKTPRSRRALARNTRAVLVDSGHLRNDIDVRKTTFQEIVIGTNDTDYGIYHNEGTDTMPQREFLGDSKGLMIKIGKLAVLEFKKEFG